MGGADCCCEPVLSLAEAFEHAQTLAREMVRLADRPDARGINELGFSYKMSETPPRNLRPSPALGEHTDELLGEIGIGESERARLRASGIVR